MSQENVEVAERIYEVLAQGVDEQALRSLVAAGLADPDAELDLSTAYPDGPVVRMATLSEFLASLPWGDSTRFEPESFRAVGSDRVLVFIRADRGRERHRGRSPRSPPDHAARRASRSDRVLH